MVIQNSSEGHRDRMANFNSKILLRQNHQKSFSMAVAAVGMFLWSSHSLAEIPLSCLGKRFYKLIPQEFLPLVRDTVLRIQFAAYRLL
jgi:hypothetical protein